ncbi:MAG: cell fate regulator YaaT (PSP1 superfamily) [Pirellulaceae bacterium]
MKDNRVSHHLVRYGQLGIVGHFRRSDSVVYPRATKVICRTPRGLELGEVLAEVEDAIDETAVGIEGEVLRRVTAEDELLQQRLILHRDEAYAACQRLLDERNIVAALVDVEVLFDGRNLIFYFLGEITPEAEEITAELAQAYEAKSQIGQFADAIEMGCGPDCGSDATGCSSGACATCVVASACHKPG